MTEPRKPRRIVKARRVIALGASAAVLGAAADGAPVAPTLSDAPSLVQRIEAEGEGVSVEAEGEGEAGHAVEAGHEAEGEAAEAEGEGDHSAEGEGESAEAEGEGEGEAAEAEGEGEGEGEASASAGGEGESEGGGATLAADVVQSRELLKVGGLLRAAEALRAAGDAEAEALIHEAAEAAEHELEGALAEELYHAIEELEDTDGDADFASVQDRISEALSGIDAAERAEALPIALREAAREYDEALEDGAIADREAYLEAFGLYSAVRAGAETLAASEDATVADVATEMGTYLDEAETAFDGVSGASIATPEASLLYGSAARMELAALKLR
jgi:hypothetical protein